MRTLPRICRLRFAVFAVAFAVALSGCAGTDAPGDSGNILTIPLTADPSNLGEIGQAAFARQGNDTSVVLTLSGVPDTLIRPVHLYTYVYRGACGKLDPKPAFALNDVVLARPLSNNARGFTLNKLVPLPLDALRSGGYAIAVRSQAPDLDQELFCGSVSK